MDEQLQIIGQLAVAYVEAQNDVRLGLGSVQQRQSAFNNLRRAVNRLPRREIASLIHPTAMRNMHCLRHDGSLGANPRNASNAPVSQAQFNSAGSRPDLVASAPRSGWPALAPPVVGE